MKFTNINFLNKSLDFLKINKIEISNMKKHNWKISGFCNLISSKNKLDIKSKFIKI